MKTLREILDDTNRIQNEWKKQQELEMQKPEMEQNVTIPENNYQNDELLIENETIPVQEEKTEVHYF